ncbi:hypothetical protein SFV1gp15 [Sulfolobus filamentous virus 1]|uniref:Uncharacterized protein n=2 Tax=Alphalipothrixvirus beppuense TaxID=2734584 RepID=A0A346LU54_SUFV1|nr:hypothetical protein HOT91_gp15 [Sulfolobus filamentous virus 1]AXQ00097.1 hypothetical protein SFV1gp15 [Sulfolobus filamentous virus 1]AZI75717.1 hypothetical protein SBFV1_gp16 [Sulfolobales Beppu filamentous phage 1]
MKPKTAVGKLKIYMKRPIRYYFNSPKETIPYTQSTGYVETYKLYKVALVDILNVDSPSQFESELIKMGYKKDKNTFYYVYENGLMLLLEKYGNAYQVKIVKIQEIKKLMISARIPKDIYVTQYVTQLYRIIEKFKFNEYLIASQISKITEYDTSNTVVKQINVKVPYYNTIKRVSQIAKIKVSDTAYLITLLD